MECVVATHMVTRSFRYTCIYVNATVFIHLIDLPENIGTPAFFSFMYVIHVSVYLFSVAEKSSIANYICFHGHIIALC